MADDVLPAALCTAPTVIDDVVAVLVATGTAGRGMRNSITFGFFAAPLPIAVVRGAAEARCVSKETVGRAPSSASNSASRSEDSYIRMRVGVVVR